MWVLEKKCFTVEEWQTCELKGVTLYPEDRKIVDLLEKSARVSMRPYSGGIIVEAGPYVGAVSLSAFDLVIRPKIENGQQFFKLIGYALELDDLRLLRDYVNLSLTKNWITDILAACLVKEINELFAKGLMKRYLEKEENLAVPRGKIDFIGLASNRARGRVNVLCRYEDLSFNVLENRALLTALNMVCPWISSPALFARARYLQEALGEEVSADNRISFLLEELEKGVDRLGFYYRKALELCKIIFRSLMFAFQGEGGSVHAAFLFNMAELFEKFLARMLKECAPPSYRIYYQSGMGGCFNSSEGKMSPLIPDFQVYYEDKHVFLADAKYKLYDQRKVDPADLYQLAVYKMVGGVEKAIIYYPSQKKISNYCEFRRPDGSGLLNIQIIGVPLELILTHINEFGVVNNTSQKFIWEELLS